VEGESFKTLAGENEDKLSLDWRSSGLELKRSTHEDEAILKVLADGNSED